MFHATCARQAGLEVHGESDDNQVEFRIHCHRHSGCEFAFRARLEDLIEVERRRAGKRLEFEDTRTMSLSHASRLLNLSILVLHCLGWAWRWAEWWVEDGANWEPLLEVGQVEADMTDEELRKVPSTRESRCEDARRCRLAAFGAALRNRSYDEAENGSTRLFDRALRAVLHTQSLVGPLEPYEIDFFAFWLGMAYRSKSRLLGFGKDKIPVDPKAPRIVHSVDKSPKYELGTRPLPGKQVLPAGVVFEQGIKEVDDFLQPERMEDGTLMADVLKPIKAKKEERKDMKLKAQKPKQAKVPSPAKPTEPIKRRPGRPPKNAPKKVIAVAPLATTATKLQRKRSGRRFRSKLFEGDDALDSEIDRDVTTNNEAVPQNRGSGFVIPRKRGRPASVVNTIVARQDEIASLSPKRRRGRPPKSKKHIAAPAPAPSYRFSKRDETGRFTRAKPVDDPPVTARLKEEEAASQVSSTTDSIQRTKPGDELIDLGGTKVKAEPTSPPAGQKLPPSQRERRMMELNPKYLMNDVTYG